MRQQVHRQRRHADVGLPARHALFGRLGIQTPVGLLVPGEVRGGRVLFPALGASVPRFLVGDVGAHRFVFRATVAHEEGFVGVGYGFTRGRFSRGCGR